MREDSASRSRIRTREWERLASLKFPVTFSSSLKRKLVFHESQQPCNFSQFPCVQLLLYLRDRRRLDQVCVSCLRSPLRKDTHNSFHTNEGIQRFLGRPSRHVILREMRMECLSKSVYYTRMYVTCTTHHVDRKLLRTRHASSQERLQVSWKYPLENPKSIITVLYCSLRKHTAWKMHFSRQLLLAVSSTSLSQRISLQDYYTREKYYIPCWRCNNHCVHQWSIARKSFTQVLLSNMQSFIY